jgi:hypothetical protein
MIVYAAIAGDQLFDASATDDVYRHREMFIMGGLFYLSSAVFGFIFPYLNRDRNSNRVESENLNALRNWNIAIMPTRGGNIRLGISFTAHF